MFDVERMNRPWPFFLFVVKDLKVPLILSVVIIMTAASIGAGTSYFFKLIVDAVEQGNGALALKYGLLFPTVIFFVQILYRMSGVTANRLVSGVVKTATDTMNEYLLGHSLNYFNNRFAGSITNKLKNVTGALEQIIPDVMWGQLTAATSFLTTYFLIWTVDTKAALLFLSLLITLALVNRALSTKKAELSKANAEASTVLYGQQADVISNATTVRQFVRGDYEFSNLKELTTKKQFTWMATSMYTEKMLFINSIITFVFFFAIFWLLTLRWQAGGISTGDFILVLALISQITSALLFVGRAFNAIARAVGEMREGLETIFIPHGIKDQSGAKALQATKGEIVWSDVTFTYNSKPVFNNFSLTIAGDTRLGLVGSSGAGKSTFVSLMLRQHDLIQGKIYIDGQDIATVTQESLRAQVAVVPQEPLLFHRSIFANIAYGKKDASREEVEKVAKLAFAHEFIVGLPEGYDTPVGERGVKLSGGQKQRIAIARAMLKNAPILILDEATSALDSESEQLIQKALHTLMEGKTVIAIAHRLSTLREMTRIIVLEKGVIAEDGTHQTLKEGSGQYASLWSHQAGGFLPD